MMEEQGLVVFRTIEKWPFLAQLSVGKPRSGLAWPALRVNITSCCPCRRCGCA